MSDPIGQTDKLFSFIGSTQKKGVDSYGQPDGFEYSYNFAKDDGSKNIQSLKVNRENLKIKKIDHNLNILIKISTKTFKLREKIGYKTEV